MKYNTKEDLDQFKVSKIIGTSHTSSIRRESQMLQAKMNKYWIVERQTFRQRGKGPKQRSGRIASVIAIRQSFSPEQLVRLVV